MMWLLCVLAALAGAFFGAWFRTTSIGERAPKVVTQRAYQGHVEASRGTHDPYYTARQVEAYKKRYQIPETATCAFTYESKMLTGERQPLVCELGAWAHEPHLGLGHDFVLVPNSYTINDLIADLEDDDFDDEEY